MLTKIFDTITRLSLRFRWVTVGIAALILALGVYAATQLNQELLPPVEFPQTIVVVQWPDSVSADEMLADVTVPLEEALQGVEGVVNVESTTNPTFAFLVARYEFGLNTDRMLTEIEAAIESAGLPEAAETQTLNFSFGDLPVVITSVSSADLSLQELKALVETELKPDLEVLAPVTQVQVSGGQELPEETAVTEPPAEIVEAVEEEAAVDEDPGRLPQLVVDGAANFGVEIEYAQDVTVELLESLSDEPNAAENVLAVLQIFPTDLLIYVPADALAYLPAEFVETLDADVAAELNDAAAEFGGIGQYTAAEAVAQLSGDAVAEVEPTVEPTAVPVEEPVVEEDAGETAVAVEPLPLPESWIAGATQMGLVITDTSDITVEMMQGIAQAAPQTLAELTPEMWRTVDPAVLEVVLPMAGPLLEPELAAQLAAIVAAANGQAAEPVALPESWIAAAAAAGLTVETTADLPAEAIGQIVLAAPELLNELTPEVLVALPPAVLAQLPAEFVAAQEPGVAQTLTILVARGSVAEVAEEGVAVDLPTFAPVDLPESWIAGAAQMGLVITSTADLTPELMQGIASVAPEQLAELTPEMWRALPVNTAAVALPFVAETLDPLLLAQLNAIQAAANGEAPTAVELPVAWQEMAASFGQPMTTTADIPPQAFGLMAGNVPPELLAELTPEIVLGLPAAALVQLPEALLANLDEGMQQTLTNIQIADALFMAASGGGDTAVSDTAVSDEDAGLLPELLIQGAAQAGVELTYAQDITPDFIRLFSSLGPQGIQALALLTPDNLRLLQPEVIALLPVDFLDTLDADLRAELDELAAEFGGAGALFLAEAAAADPARLPEVIVQGATQAGFEVEVAQDVSPEMIRLFGGLGEQGIQILALMTPDNLRLLQPEVIALLPVDFLDTLDGDLRAELDELAAEFGGAGALFLAEAAAAEAASAEAPALTGIWVEPGPDGEEALFQTAYDLLDNGFLPTAAELLNFLPESPNADQAPQLMADLTPEVMAYLVENEEGFVAALSPTILELMSPETLTFLLTTYPEAFDAELTARLAGIAAGTIAVFIPEASVTRTDGNPAVIVQVYKGGDENTVETAHQVFDTLAAFEAAHPGITTSLVFEQATFIEESIAGVSREGALGAVFAILVILVFLSGHVGGRYKLSWRATLVTAVSIPLSIFSAFLLMWLLPQIFGVPLQNWSDSSGSGIAAILTRLFPSQVTLNIMTLSGLTVAIGRVVDDSIVVLENSYRYIQKGENVDEAILHGTREVAVAIFSATVTTMVVFLPLGFVGGIIGSVFMPFGLTVVWALAASFVVSITVVPALISLFINKDNIPEEEETKMQKWYTPMLEWALTHRALTLGISTVIFFGSLFLMSLLPQSFIPALGEPTINVRIELPSGTPMAETDAAVAAFEAQLAGLEGLGTVQTEVGSGGGLEAFFTSGSVAQNLAAVTISVEDQEELDTLTKAIRAKAVAQFGEEIATVSAASQTGFSGFSLTVTGDSLEELLAVTEDVKAAIGEVDLEGDGVPDIANVSSSVDELLEGDSDTTVYIRIDGRPAVSFSGELETTNTLGVTSAAKEAILAVQSLPPGAVVSEGFESQQQVEGFRSMLTAILISIVLVYAVMAITFRSFILPLVILFSLPFALIGAAIALYVSNSVLGISALIGFMMLVGIVVTNGIVLMELVQQLRAKGVTTYDALVEAGRTRLRPIWMTALTAILALIPLALSAESGALIASDLARAVMGGLTVSTALTLVVVPIVFYLFEDLSDWIARKMGRDSSLRS